MSVKFRPLFVEIVGVHASKMQEGNAESVPKHTPHLLPTALTNTHLSPYSAVTCEVERNGNRGVAR